MAVRTGTRWVTPWGQPDLQGVWTTDDARGVPLQRSAQYGSRAELTYEEFAEREKRNTALVTALDQGGTLFLQERGVRSLRQTSLVIEPADGRIPPLTADGQLRADAAAAALTRRPISWLDRPLGERCVSRGVVGSILPGIYGNGLQILQTPDSVVILYEMIHETRIVPMHETPHVGTGVLSYMGDPRGRWDGDTLVVETTNLVGKTGIGRGGAPTTPALHLVERFRRVAADRIDYEVTIDDPGTYTAPFKIALPLTTQPGYQLMPYECHEGNAGLRNILSAARAEERALAAGVVPSLSLWRDPAAGEPGDVHPPQPRE